MLSKQLPGLLLAAALQQLAYAFPLNGAVDGPSQQPRTTCEPKEITCPGNLVVSVAGFCQGSFFLCNLIENIVPIGECVKCDNGLWVPSRQWTAEEHLDYWLGRKKPSPP